MGKTIDTYRNPLILNHEIYVPELAEELGFHYSTIYKRLKKGYGLNEVVKPKQRTRIEIPKGFTAVTMIYCSKCLEFKKHLMRYSRRVQNRNKRVVQFCRCRGCNTKHKIESDARKLKKEDNFKEWLATKPIVI